MIISHELNVILSEIKKVAGTSFEIALSRFCGQDDVTTPISPSDENTPDKAYFTPLQLPAAD